jgi:hypothetical protein
VGASPRCHNPLRLLLLCSAAAAQQRRRRQKEPPAGPAARLARRRTRALRAMGNDLSRAVRAWKARKLRRVLLLGLDGAGKTTVLAQVLGTDASATVPTVEAEYREKEYKGQTLLLTVSMRVPARLQGTMREDLC